ncbi:MAG TPA: serine hydrolase domain-containing protein [Kofleriaceae bacterium]|nr:serine hydrolase domain-containing protein [Kofleriaceae bacterium]
MKVAIFVLAALASGCGSPAGPVPVGVVAIDPALSKRLDTVIDKAIAGEQLVGVSVMIARDGKIVYARAAGFADREAARPANEDTQFRIASMTKPVVSVAALALIDQGKLSLEDPVTKWLPSFRPKLADGREPVITVRHLLTHTSGLTYKFLEPAGGPYHKAEVSDGLADPEVTAEVNLRRLASVPLLYEPGTAWGYSLSVDVLGEVVARAGGGTLPAVVARLVTGPLAMTATMFTVTDRARLAWPYAAGKPPVRMTEPYDLSTGGQSARLSPARIFDPAAFPSGGAGLASTARDYLRFLEALRTGGAPVLKPETARSLSENQIGALAVSFLGPGAGFGFGVGVTVDPAAAGTPKGPGSFGWGGIYGGSFWIDPKAQLSVVVFMNLAGDSPFEQDLIHAVYEAGP